ncbi:hypothetical protein LSCM1_01457 [Leishmania martiniquensis]|uniref:Uncharacterized protein n=1 Tax=Leishmania martiniquensis TaxID=1580590 RepID=A0A836H791_9TRYP|nr:hypothetical protein LSCM1_01457 [Leishmania martiniquensis]
MGAAPSRETAERCLSQPPFYGQRQQIALIPLLRKFFPSPDCPLFVQLYEARCDPAVRYYYYANDGIRKAQSTPASPASPMAHAAHESVGDVASPTYLAEVIGSSPVYCPPADVFPSVPMTREAMYDAYITNGGERMVYETDMEMLRAYRADATSVRPLPCAVAFLYHRPASEASPTNSSAAWDAGSEKFAGTASSTDAASGTTYSFPEDCTDVLGCYVKATGFVGDVHGLGASSARKLPDYEMQMFLTKSAGDHHRTHVLLTAVYTYAEQWQRACLHCVPCDLMAKELAPASKQDGGAADKDLGDVFFYYKRFSHPPEMLLEASRTAACHRVARAASAEGSGKGSGALESGERAQFWAPPPLPSLFMRSRRANVPLLCFLREVRACARSFFLFCLQYQREHQGRPGPRRGDGGADGEAEKQCPILPPGQATGENCLFYMPPPGSAQMWLQDVTRVPLSLTEDDGEGDGTDTESMLNFHVVAPYVRALTEFIVACLLHNINPLEVFQLSAAPADAAGADVKDPTATGEAPAAVAGGVGASFLSSATAEMMAGSPTSPHSVSFIRLPDEDMLVQSWPPSNSGGEAGGEASTTVTAATAASPSGAGVLSAWRSRHTDRHLFWPVGPDISNRRSATAALLHWCTTEGAPVAWGYRPDERSREMAAGGSAPAEGFPPPSWENYMSTVTVNGQKEELLRCNTVLSLVPLPARTPAEARVLCVCRLPLEELLLGELRNSSKIAREAGPEDLHWVRQIEGVRGDGGAARYTGCVLRASDSPEEAPRDVMVGKGSGLPVVPAEADGIIGDGTSCLWRVNLIERVCRIIAVTPQFLKQTRKKHTKKKKKWQPKADVVRGTASDVFRPVASPSSTTASAMSASPETASPAQMDEAGSREREITAARALINSAPHRQEAVALHDAQSCNTAAAPSLVATGAATTADASATPAANGQRKEQRTVGVAEAPTSASTRSASGLEAGDEGAPLAVLKDDNATAPAKIDTAGQLQPTKGAQTTSAERSSKTAEPAREGLPTTAPQPTAGKENMQRAWSPSATPTLLVAGNAKVAKLAAGTSATAEKTKERKTGETASRSSTGGATETSGATTTTPTPTHAMTPNTEKPRAAPSPLRYMHPTVPAGEHDAKSINGKASALDKCRAPSSLSSLDGASVAAYSPHHSPEYSRYPHPPSYSAYPLPPPLLRGSCEQYACGNGYSSQMPPLPPPSAGPHSGVNAPSTYGAQCHGSQGHPPYASYGSSGDHSSRNASSYYYPGMSSGATGVADASGPMGEGGYTDSLYVYAAPSQQLFPPHQPQRHPEAIESCPGKSTASLTQPYDLSAKDTGSRYETVRPVVTEVSPSLTPQESEVCLSFATSISRQGTASSFRHYVGSGAGGGLSTAAAADNMPYTSVAEVGGALRRASEPYGDPAAALLYMSPTTHRPRQHHTFPMPSPLLLQGSDAYSLQMSPDFEDCHNVSASCTDSHLHLQLDELNSAASNGSSTLRVNGQHWHHTSFAGSLYQDGTTVTEEVGVLCGEGGGPVGGSVNVTVRVRHHHGHAHAKTASFFSDTTTDPASGPHHNDLPFSMNGGTSAASCGGSGVQEASLTGRQLSHSFTSAEPSPTLSWRALGAGNGSVREHSFTARGDQPHHVSVACQPNERQLRHHAPGAAASSTRSGDTASTARLMDKRTGTYRWDWRTAALDMGEED